jgi:hypothetical protein
MAYRAAEHETTENTPNYMMLGREVTTPLDIQYYMPRSIAHIPQNVTSVIFTITLKGPLHKHASLVVNPGLTFGKKTNT